MFRCCGIDVGEALNNVWYVCGLVALAAMGRGREVWGIGFENDSLQGYRGGKYVRECGLLECDHASDAEVEVWEAE